MTLEIPFFGRALRALEEIKDGLVFSCSASYKLRVDEVLDIPFIKAQVEAGLFVWDDCHQLMKACLVLILDRQAPVRRAETTSRWQALEADMVMRDQPDLDRMRRLSFASCLEFFFDCIQTIRNDSANAKLRLVIIPLREHGIDYERGKFQAALSDGTFTLERVTRWIHDTLQTHISAGPDRKEALNKLLDGHALTYVNLVQNGVLDLICGAEDQLHQDLCPETLFFDVRHLRLAYFQFKTLTVAASMLVVARQLLHTTLLTVTPLAKQTPAALKAAILAQTEQKDQVAQALSIISDALVNLSGKQNSIAHMFEELKDQLEPLLCADLLKRVLASMGECIAPTHPVHRVMYVVFCAACFFALTFS